MKRSSGFRPNMWPTLPRFARRGTSSRTGRCSTNPTSSLRGLAFYRTGSLGDARRLAEQDPAVRAGRLAIEVMTWWCPYASMVMRGQLVSSADV
jgi:hypothetical protein